MAVSKRVRFEVLKRDNHACRYCGACAPDATLTIDHVTPVALGGTDDPTNLVAACRDCNAGKASTAPDAAVVEDVSQDALRWSRAMSEAVQVTLAERDARMDYLSHFEQSWRHSMPINWESTLTALYGAHLPVDELDDAIYAAQTARNLRDSRFVYFCGAAWRRVRKIQEIARALVENEQ